MASQAQGNPNYAPAEWPPVVVMGAYRTGVVLMRDLVRRGLTVCCVDSNPEQYGFRTVYGKAWLCPNPDEQPEKWLEFMIGLSKKHARKPVLMSSADVFVSAMAQHAERLAEHFVFVATGAVTQSLLATKKRQYELSDAHGLSAPRTQFVTNSEEVAAFGREARFPCLLKPLHFRDWERFPAGHPLLGEKIALADSPADLADKYRLASEASADLMVQEIIEGPDTAKLVYLSCYDRTGERIGACMVRELRTTPVLFGSASVVEPVTDPEADALCDGFLRGIGYKGICEIEIKRDTRDGVVKMIEANPRYSVTADVASYAGVDIGWLHYLDLISDITGNSVVPVVPSGRDFRHIVLERDSATFWGARHAGLLSWGELFRSYRPPLAFFDFDLRDWRLTLSTIDRVFRNLLSPLVRRVIPRRH